MKTVFPLAGRLPAVPFFAGIIQVKTFIRYQIPSGDQKLSGRFGIFARPFFAAIFLLQCLSANAGNILKVPADYPTIQSAVNAAQEGDTVLVSPGTYLENIQLQGRNIVLSSRYFLEPNPSNTIKQTIIDGSQPVHPDTASCILIFRGESAATVIQGFTIQGGKGTVWLDPAGAGTFREGGGILTEGSSPIIRHNIIQNNIVTPGGAGLVSVGGGGIRSGEGAVRIENNTIIHNKGQGYGGGIVLNYCSGAVVQNNIIAYNYGGKDFSGGGFWATGANQNTVNVLKNNTIVYNESPAASGANGGKGGGILVYSIKVLAQNNIVWGNKQASGKQIAQGGGQIVLTYNCVQDNSGGTGTITSNPVFRDTLGFILEAGSPAIDAGNPDLADADFSHNGKRAAFPGRGSLRNDLGAYGGVNNTNPAVPNPFLNPAIFSKVLNSPVTTTEGDSRSVNWIDIDSDGDLDLFISNGPEAGENNMLYRNNGTGGFTAVTGDPIVMDGKPSDGATWADFDNDGDIDCFVVNWYGVNNLCYTNNGNGTFTQVILGAFVNDGGHSETASWGDYNLDGWLDLYVTNSFNNESCFLYHNLQNGTFERVPAGAAATTISTARSVNWVDYDLDGDMDLFVTNEGSTSENENLYKNNSGNVNFTKVTSGPLVNDGGKTMSSSWADFDNDGDLDVVLANDQGNESLFTNDGSGNFTKITVGPVVSSGGKSFGSNWGDVDNDGDLDLFITNSFGTGSLKNFLFINNGDGSFTKNTTELPAIDAGWSYGCAFGDFDRDGDLDLGVATCQGATQPDYLYENHSAENQNHWLGVHCVGTISNKSAIGTLVHVQTNINGQPVTLLRDISAQSGYCGQNQLDAHFGLGDATEINITVDWPSGVQEVFGNIAVDQYITIVEGLGITSVQQPSDGKSQLVLYPIVPNPFSDSITVSWEQPKAGTIMLDIFGMDGKPVLHQSLNGIAGKQEWEWNGKSGLGKKLPAGAYVLVLQDGGLKVSKQMVKQ